MSTGLLSRAFMGAFRFLNAVCRLHSLAYEMSSRMAKSIRAFVWRPSSIESLSRGRTITAVVKPPTSFACECLASEH